MEIETCQNLPRYEAMPPGMVEVYGHWRSACRGRAMPAVRDFRLDALPSDAPPWCAVVDVVPEPLDFIYRFHGTKRREMQGDEFTGRSVLEIQPLSFAKKTFGELKAVVEGGAALHIATACETPGGPAARYETLRLPLGDGGAGVAQVVSYMVGGAYFERFPAVFADVVPFRLHPE